MIHLERTLTLCIGRTHLRKNYLKFLDMELQIWLAKDAQTTIFDGYQLKKEQFCHPKQQSLSLLLYFLHRAFYILALFSARGHSEAGFKLGDRVLEMTCHRLDFFLSKHSCLWSVCYHFFMVAPKKTETTLNKISLTPESFGTLLNTRTF